MVDLKTFFEHLYILTKCDASFSHYHFIDDNEQVIGYIHYDGEVRIDTLNKHADERFLHAIQKTAFEDAGRKNASSL
jgi:hypothetical protein